MAFTWSPLGANSEKSLNLFIGLIIAEIGKMKVAENLFYEIRGTGKAEAYEIMKAGL